MDYLAIKGDTAFGCEFPDIDPITGLIDFPEVSLIAIGVADHQADPGGLLFQQLQRDRDYLRYRGFVAP